MSISLIISILIIIVIFGLALKLFHKVLHAILLTVAFVVVVTLATGFFLYQDINDLRTNFASSDNLFLLNTNGSLETGIIASFDELDSDTEQGITFLTENTLASYQRSFAEEDYKELRGEEIYKVIIFDIAYFNRTLPANITLTQDITLTKQQSMQLLTADNAYQSFIDIMFRSVYSGTSEFEGMARPVVEDAIREQFSNQFDITNNREFRSFMFLTFISQTLVNQKGTSSILTLTRQYKKDNIMIYPQTFFFKIVSIVPLDIIDSLFEKAIDSVKEQAPVSLSQ